MVKHCLYENINDDNSSNNLMPGYCFLDEVIVHKNLVDQTMLHHLMRKKADLMIMLMNK